MRMAKAMKRKRTVVSLGESPMFMVLYRDEVWKLGKAQGEDLDP